MRREQVRGGRSEREHEYLRERARLQGDDERIARDRIAELADERAGRDSSEDRHHRQRAERERRRGDDREGGLHRSTITDVALTTPVASTPGSRPSASAES